MATGRTVNQVSAAGPGPPFQADELANHLAVVEQVDGLRIDDSHKVTVQFGPAALAWVVIDAVLAELLPRKFASVSVAANCCDAIFFQDAGIFLDDGCLGIERR
jgi:hypothetical protein